MTRRLIPPSQQPQAPSLKDEQGAYLPQASPPALPAESHTPSPADTNINEVLGRQLLALGRLTRHLASKASSNSLTVPEMGALATLIKLTMELKIKENELLDKLSDEQLQAAAHGSTNPED